METPDTNDLELIAKYSSKKEVRDLAWEKLAEIYVNDHKVEDSISMSKNPDAPMSARLVAGRSAVEMIFAAGIADYDKLLLLADDDALPPLVRVTAAIKFVEGHYKDGWTDRIFRALEDENLSEQFKEVAGREYVRMLIEDGSGYALKVSFPKLLHSPKVSNGVKENAKMALADYADELATRINVSAVKS